CHLLCRTSSHGRSSRLFFFSSRRRHTRFSRDWSSDVCSSDLDPVEVLVDIPQEAVVVPGQIVLGRPAPFGRREVESGKFDRIGHRPLRRVGFGFWRGTGDAPYKGRCARSEAGAAAHRSGVKSLLGNPVFQFIVGRLIGGYMLFVGVTTRWTKINRAAVEPFWEPDGGKVIGCIWHGRFALVHKMWSFKRSVPKAKMLISQSREGGIVAHTSRTVGAEVIRGSEAKKGSNKPKRGI